jgi:hypothetical protein
MPNYTAEEMEKLLDSFDSEMHEVVPKIQQAVSEHSPEVIIAACAFIAGGLGVMFNMDRERFLRHVFAMVQQGLDIQQQAREQRIATHQATATVQ